MNCDLDATIPDWIIEYPVTTRVFTQLQLDVSCAGKSLRYICHQQGLCADDVLLRLRKAIAGDRQDL